MLFIISNDQDNQYIYCYKYIIYTGVGRQGMYGFGGGRGFVIGRSEKDCIQARGQCERVLCFAYMYMPRYQPITLHHMVTYLW